MLNQKNQLKFFCAIIMAMVMVGLPTYCQSEDLLSCVLLAQKSDPQLLKAKDILEAAHAGKDITRSILFPHLVANASVSLNKIHLKGFGPKIDDTFLSDSYSVILSQSILNGPAWSQIKVANKELRKSIAAVEATEQDLIMRVVYAYFNLLKANIALEAALSEQNLLQETYERAEYMLETGNGDIVSLHEAKARLDNSKAKIIELKNKVQIAKKNLNRVVHANVGPVKDVNENLAPLPPSPNNLQEWIDSALKTQPILIEAKAGFESAQKQLEQAKRARWPRVELFAGRNYIKGRLMPRLHSGEWLAGLKVDFPVFLGGQIGAKQQKARALSLAARHELAKREDQIILATETAFLNLKNSIALVQASKTALESAKIALSATKEGLEAGTRNTVDLLEQITRLENSRRQYVYALYHHLISRFELKFACGALNIQDVASINTLLTDSITYHDN